MSPLGGAMKALLGLALAWAWWNGKLARLTDLATGKLGGQAAGAAPASAQGGAAPSPSQLA